MLAKLPENPGPEVLAEIRALDQRLDGKPGEPMARLRVGIVAVLGRSGEAESLAYLAQTCITTIRNGVPPVAMSLTQHPDGENWPILVDSLRTVDGEAAREILGAGESRIGNRRHRSRIATRFCSACDCRRTAANWWRELLEKWVGQNAVQGRCAD